MKLTRYADAEGKPIGWAHYCPACSQIHVFNVEQPTRPYPEFKIKGGVRWSFNGNLERPTFKPSMLITSGGWQRPDGKEVPRRTVCHYHLIAGALSYCADSPRFAGKKIPLPDMPARDAPAAEA